jgi:hypothetical protein
VTARAADVDASADSGSVVSQGSWAVWLVVDSWISDPVHSAFSSSWGCDECCCPHSHFDSPLCLTPAELKSSTFADALLCLELCLDFPGTPP